MARLGAHGCQIRKVDREQAARHVRGVEAGDEVDSRDLAVDGHRDLALEGENRGVVSDQGRGAKPRSQPAQQIVFTHTLAVCGTASGAGSGAVSSMSASFSTSSMCSTKWKTRSFLIVSGISTRSRRLSLGTIMVWMPAILAASVFSFRPPIGSTSPRSVISPVMATRRLTAFFVRTEMIAVPMVMPAEGPSFGI